MTAQWTKVFVCSLCGILFAAVGFTEDPLDGGAPTAVLEVAHFQRGVVHHAPIESRPPLDGGVGEHELPEPKVIERPKARPTVPGLRSRATFAYKASGGVTWGGAAVTAFVSSAPLQPVTV